MLTSLIIASAALASCAHGSGIYGQPTNPIAQHQMCQSCPGYNPALGQPAAAYSASMYSGYSPQSGYTPGMSGAAYPAMAGYGYGGGMVTVKPKVKVDSDGSLYTKYKVKEYGAGYGYPGSAPTYSPHQAYYPGGSQHYGHDMAPAYASYGTPQSSYASYGAPRPSYYGLPHSSHQQRHGYGRRCPGMLGPRARRNYQWHGSALDDHCSY